MIKSLMSGAFAIVAMLAWSGPASANAVSAGMKMKPADTSAVSQVRRGGGFFGRGHGGGVRAFRGGGHRHFGGGRAFRHYGGHSHRRHWRPHRGIYFAAPFIGYGYGYRSYGYRDCHWLKRKAIRTGSRYWWRRYARCRGRW